MQGADGWQLSTPNIMAMASHRAALDLFEKAGFENLLTKSRQLQTYLMAIIDHYPQIKMLTPRSNEERGCQLSLLINHNGKAVFERLKKAGIWGDWREPNCIRLSPVPLYNSFLDIFKVEQAFKEIFG
jgi:kynureninase